MKLIFTIIFSGMVALSFGQSVPRFSQFNVAKGLMNPAAVGTDARFSVDMMYRNQWTGTQGTPNTMGVVVGYEINRAHAVGLTALNDRIGVAKSTGINASYAYRLNFNDEQYFAFGASAGIQNVNSDYSRLYILDQNDPAFAQNYNQWKFNAGFGMYYNGPRMYAGFSIPELMTNVHSGPDNGFSIRRWHYYLNAGFYLGGKGKYTMNPCIQVKMATNAPVQGDLLIRNIINGTFSINVGYRSENALIAGFDFMIVNRLRFGYAFNYNLGPVSQFLAMSHEVFLGVGLPYYYEGDRFQQRKYLNKGIFTKDYKRRAKRFHKRR